MLSMSSQGITTSVQERTTRGSRLRIKMGAANSSLIYSCHTYRTFAGETMIPRVFRLCFVRWAQRCGGGPAVVSQIDAQQHLLPLHLQIKAPLCEKMYKSCGS